MEGEIKEKENHHHQKTLKTIHRQWGLLGYLNQSTFSVKDMP